jgi:general secretion pathway protein K
MKRRGFALLAALWFVVVISGLIFGISLTARERRLATINVADEIQAAAVASAGIADMQAQLQQALYRDRSELAATSARWRTDPWFTESGQRELSSPLGSARFVVSARDAGTLINLNRISADDFRAFLQALRIDAGRADAIAQSALDWRDGDDSRRAHGAEFSEYLRANALVLPPNRRFRRVEELRSVHGVTSKDYDLVRPYLTLLGSGYVNINAADRPVLMSLPGMTEEIVSAILQARRSRVQLTSLNDLANLLPPSQRDLLAMVTPALLERLVFTTREMAVRSVGTMEGSPMHITMIALIVRGDESALLVARKRLQ